MDISGQRDDAEVLRSIIDFLPSGISLIDEELNVVAWNRQFKEKQCS